MIYALMFGVAGGTGYHFGGLPGFLLGLVCVFIVITIRAITTTKPAPKPVRRHQQTVVWEGSDRSVFADTRS